MKVHLERATPAHVQTFASALPSADDELAREAGFSSAQDGVQSMLDGSREAFALVERGPLLDRVIAMTGIFRLRPGALWVHTAPAFKTAGFGALRVARMLIDRFAVDYGELTIDVDSTRPELVRLADWLGFRARGAIERFGRPHHCCVLRRAA